MKIGNWLSGLGRTKMIEVHHFKILDAATGKWIVPPHKCSEKRILELKGKIVDGTMEIVARASLDKDGCYDPELSRKNPS